MTTHKDIKTWQEQFREAYPNYPMDQISPTDKITWLEKSIADLRAYAEQVERERDELREQKALLQITVQNQHEQMESLHRQSPQPVGAVVAMPEIDGLQDIEYALNTPDDWDADYRAIWQKLQVAERNKMQWRGYALKLRDALSEIATKAAFSDCPAIARSALAAQTAEPQTVGGVVAGELDWKGGAQARMVSVESYKKLVRLGQDAPPAALAAQTAEPATKSGKPHRDRYRAAIAHFGGKWPEHTGEVTYFNGGIIYRDEFELRVSVAAEAQRKPQLNYAQHAAQRLQWLRDFCAANGCDMEAAKKAYSVMRTQKREFRRTKKQVLKLVVKHFKGKWPKNTSDTKYICGHAITRSEFMAAVAGAKQGEAHG